MHVVRLPCRRARRESSGEQFTSGSARFLRTGSRLGRRDPQRGERNPEVPNGTKRHDQQRRVGTYFAQPERDPTDYVGLCRNRSLNTPA